jgi:choline-sulfatase
LPTLVELAGGDPQDLPGGPVDGRSFVPHCEGRDGHDEAFGEYLAEGAVAPLVMIRREGWKFVHSPADPDQLFDIASDPDELHNQAANPDHGSLVSSFRVEAARRWDFPALDAAVRDSQHRRRFVDAALTTGSVTPWDFQPFRDASRQYMRNTVDLDDLEARARFPRVRP